jgi:hypothetical protein
MPRSLTVLIPVREGEAEALRDVLRAIGDDIRGRTAAAGETRPHIDFTGSRTVHFARFALLRDPARGPDATRLLFTSVYDGTLGDHLDDLRAITSDVDAIWGRCRGYAGSDALPAFIRAHALEPAAVYVAFPAERVASIRHAQAVRRRVQDAAEAGGGALAAIEVEAWRMGGWHRRVAARLEDAVRRVLRVLPLAADVVRAIWRHGLGTVYGATSRIVASLGRIRLFRVTNWLTRNRMPPRESPSSSVTLDNCAGWTLTDDRDEVPAAFDTPPSYREDAVAQNQLTLVTVVDPQHVARVKAVMAAIDSYARRLAPPGSLLGISTIHVVRWLLIDDDRRLVMLSDYDGSWENYIDEFAEMILSGLDAIWDTSYGYPPDGARDLPAFKRFLRTHQVPAEVFYSAYPAQTLLNMAGNLRLTRAIERGTEPLTARLPTLWGA